MTLPTPTVIAAAGGYIPTGKRRVSFVPTVAVVTAPTLSELSAGSDITNAVASYTGFSGTSNTVDNPNMGSRWTPKVPGMIDAADSTITLSMDAAGTNAALALFSDGSDGTTPTSGFIVIYYTGIVTAGKCRVFPVTVTSVAESSDGAAAATADVSFAITDPPSQRIAIPTA